MKNLKRILLLVVVILAVAIYFNYPKLNILAGYSAKNTASSVFLAERSLAFTDENDNNFSPINLTSDAVNKEEKSATGSAFGLLKRKAIYREGLGAVLINDNYDASKKILVPKRSKPDNSTPFPYGNADQKDTLFSNIDYKKLNETIDTIFNDVNQTRSVLVIYKDQIIAEKYSDGFDKNSKQLGWSMTKSIVAALYGILEHQGKIDMSYRPFKELDLTGLLGKDPREFIPLNDFLRMSSGLEWDEDYASISDVNKMLFMEADMTKSQINTHYNSNNPKVWNYSSGTTNFLSGVLRKQFKTYQDYLDFPYSELIDKIGMHSMLIETDMAGNFVGSSYGWASTRDWAKFGLLHLNRGNWNGEQLFDPKWIDYITKPTEGSKEGYGAHWWLNAGGKYPDVPRDMYSANGFLGQRVFIIPSKDLVIVRTGLAKDPDFDINGFLSDVVAAIN